MSGMAGGGLLNRDRHSRTRRFSFTRGYANEMKMGIKLDLISVSDRFVAMASARRVKPDKK
jgi:hypothetical protein